MKRKAKYIFRGHCLILAMLFAFSAIAQQKPLVVCTASMFADMTQQIGGDYFEVATLVPIGGDPHIHEPTPRDARIVARADLILKNGLTFEGWINELIENAGSKATIITITDGIKPIESQTYKGATDPHAWMDATLGLTYIKNVHSALVQLSPDLRDELDLNYAAYREKLEETDRYIREKVKSIPEANRILITSHDAFQYFGRQYGIQLESVMGVSTDADIQTSDIIRLNKVIQTTPVPAVFIESTINPKVLEQLAHDNGIVVGGKLYADSLGDEDSPAPTYIEMLRHNINVIAGGLSKERQPVAAENENDLSFYFIFGGIFLALILLGVFFMLRSGKPA